MLFPGGAKPPCWRGARLFGVETTMATARTKASARTAARKPLSKSRTKAAPAARKRAAPPKPSSQIFRVSHHSEEDFEVGLRRYAKYRDLGMAKATSGKVQAHVIRFVPPCRPEEVSKLHYHDVEFQMIYVLKGWIKTELEGQGAHVMRPGSAWIQPPRIKHKVLDYSDDAEVLEIILPADFDTVELT
jgi:quercetin dioxygenase-like cupin family protein